MDELAVLQQPAHQIMKDQPADLQVFLNLPNQAQRRLQFRRFQLEVSNRSKLFFVGRLLGKHHQQYCDVKSVLLVCLLMRFHNPLNKLVFAKKGDFNDIVPCQDPDNNCRFKDRKVDGSGCLLTHFEKYQPVCKHSPHSDCKGDIIHIDACILEAHNFDYRVDSVQCSDDTQHIALVGIPAGGNVDKDAGSHKGTDPEQLKKRIELKIIGEAPPAAKRQMKDPHYNFA